MHRCRWFAARILLVALFGVAGTLPAAAQAPGDANVANQFLGVWRLVSWTQRATDGTARPSPANTGYLVYSDASRMCAVLMDSGRPKRGPQPPATVAEALARTAGFISYCAAVDVHATEGFVLHHVDVELNPGSIGITRKRWFVFEGPDVLLLRIDPSELGSGTAESTLRWERVKK